MLPIGLPEPIRRGQREVAEAALASRQLRGSLLKPAELDRQGAKQDGKADDRTNSANRDDYRLAAPRGKSYVLRNTGGDGKRVTVDGLDRENTRDAADITGRAIGAAAMREIFVPR